jgi:hypothetical protein
MPWTRGPSSAGNTGRHAWNQQSIPRHIVASPASEELICLHEAGHALVSLDCGVVPNLIEIIPGPPICARVNTPATGEDRHVISLGGFAAELRLFLDRRLVDQAGRAIVEVDFIHLACGVNAQLDKEVYFGKDHSKDGHWPTELDTEFMEFARKIASHMDMRRLEVLAGALLNERTVDATRIRTLVGA